MVRPSIEQGARLWPFDGTLADLSRSPGVVVAETYPGEAYHHIGIQFAPTQSKTSQQDRQTKANISFDWATRNRVVFDADTKQNIQEGFGASSTGEDAFDAFAGLLSMIEVADGRRTDGPTSNATIKKWEGWILGQQPQS